MEKELLFKKVKCSGLLKKVYDGKYICKDEDGNCFYSTSDGKKTPVPEDDYDGSLNFLKTYYKRVKHNFSGVVVGFKDVVVTGYLYVETNYAFDGREYTKVGKEAKETERCAIVYYSNNRKHMVPVNMIESE